MKGKYNLFYLFSHIKTFMNREGGLHSLTITYWEQEFKCLPNIMNNYPYIEGIVRLLQVKENIILRQTLEKLVNFIIHNQNKEGFFNYSFGDIQNTPPPPIIQIATSYALLKAYYTMKNEKILSAINHNWNFIQKHYIEKGILKNKVVNQNSILLLFLIEYKQIIGKELLDIRVIKDFILQYQHQNGGFFQAYHLSDQLSFYNAKVGLGLLKYFVYNHDKEVLESLKKLYGFLKKNYSKDLHLFYCGFFTKYTLLKRIKRVISKDNIEFFHNLNFRLRKYPIFISRSANTFRFMWEYAKNFKEDDINYWESEIKEYVKIYQRENGSFANAIGLAKNNNEKWKDVSSVIRFESYVFNLMTNFFDFEIDENYQSELQIKTDDFLYEEFENKIVFVYKNIKKEVNKWQEL